MKKVLFAVFLIVVVIGCKSNEEKANALIKDQLFKTLYDFESYEPIETIIDSAFTSIYRDSSIQSDVLTVSLLLEKFNEHIAVIERADKEIKIWKNSRSESGRSRYVESVNEFKENLYEAEKYMKIIDTLKVKIKNEVDTFNPTYTGWLAKHKFRCKTKGGQFDLVDNYYYIDPGMNEIIYMEKLDDESVYKLRGLLDEIIQSKNN